MSELEDTLRMIENYDLSSVERIILTSTGTVQDLLSIIFGTPVRVEVISQLNCESVLIRWVKLIVDDPDPLTVALAKSVIPYKTNKPEFVSMMEGGDIGIGYAINKLGIPRERQIHGIHVDKYTFARAYQIRGDMLDVVITETFQRELYNGI